MHPATMHLSDHFLKSSIALVSFYIPEQVDRQSVLIIGDISFTFFIGPVSISILLIVFAHHFGVLVLPICWNTFSTDIHPCHVRLRLYTFLLFCLLILT